MNLKNSFKFSLLVFLLLALLMLVIRVDSYSWGEPITDAEYHIRGVWFALGWVMTFAIACLTFLTLILVGWLRLGIPQIFKFFKS